MANHCIYKRCFECKDEYCLRGCGYTCKCKKEADDPAEVAVNRAREEKAEQELVDNLPEGWF